MKNIKGITLIVLVITIIILLILAGVTISLLTGENGILNKATKAVNENDKQTEKEISNLKIADSQIEKYIDEKNTSGETSQDTETIANLKAQIESLKSELSKSNTVTATEDKILKNYTAYKNGNIITGTMQDNGTISETLASGESYTIPQGYHDGNGTIKVAGEPTKILKYETHDKSNFTSTYTADNDCLVIATSIVGCIPPSLDSRGYANTNQSTSGTVLSQYSYADINMSPYRFIQKIYKLSKGQNITCTSSAYIWGHIFHLFAIY